MIDSMHNTNYFTPTALVGGTLVGAFLARKSGGLDPGAVDRRPDRARPTAPIPLVVAAILLVSIEILGRLPRGGPTPEPRPAPEVVGPSQSP